MRNLSHLTRALVRSNDHPVLVLKHSQECGLSSRALAEFKRVAHTGNTADYWVLTVQRSRRLSKCLVERLQVAHATPQVLLLRHGAVAWLASHSRVNADALEKALRTWA